MISGSLSGQFPSPVGRRGRRQAGHQANSASHLQTQTRQGQGQGQSRLTSQQHWTPPDNIEMMHQNEAHAQAQARLVPGSHPGLGTSDVTAMTSSYHPTEMLQAPPITHHQLIHHRPIIEQSELMTSSPASAQSLTSSTAPITSSSVMSQPTMTSQTVTELKPEYTVERE